MGANPVQNGTLSSPWTVPVTEPEPEAATSPVIAVIPPLAGVTQPNRHFVLTTVRHSSACPAVGAVAG
jgi:hypothetical protein